MEPTTILSGAGLAIKTLELVYKRQLGKISKKENQQLYDRIFSSLLWEIYQNLKRCGMIINVYKNSSVRLTFK